MAEALAATVLVVVPHQVLRKLVVEFVQQLPLAVRVWEADCAQSGLDRALETSPSIVVMGVALPDLPASEALRRMKALAPGSRIVVISDQPVDVYRRVALENGADLCLSKDALGCELMPALLALSRLAGPQ